MYSRCCSLLVAVVLIVPLWRDPVQVHSEQKLHFKHHAACYTVTFTINQRSLELTDILLVEQQNSSVTRYRLAEVSHPVHDSTVWGASGSFNNLKERSDTRLHGLEVHLTTTR